MAHGDAREGKWGGNWRTEWVASTLHTTSEHGVSSITTADAHTSAASSRLNWPPTHRRFKGTRPFRRKTKSGFCACAITFQLASTMPRLSRNFALPPYYRENRPPSLQSTRGHMWSHGDTWWSHGDTCGDHVGKHVVITWGHMWWSHENTCGDQMGTYGDHMGTYVVTTWGNMVITW